MLQVKVSRKKNEATGICSFELLPANNGVPLPAFEAGAHIDVHIADGLTRQYSLCNNPSEHHRYLISVLHDPNSRGGSKAMHEQVQQGQVLTISEPRNLFPLAQKASRHLLFGGGIGITPIVAMAYDLHHLGADFELHYCYRSIDRAAFLDELSDAPFAHRIKFHDDSGPQDQKLNTSVLLACPDHSTHLYVCGPSGFMNHVLDCAHEVGWMQECVHREFFAAAPVDTTGDSPFEVELASSGKVFLIPVDRTVFEVLDEAGIEIETSCEQGVCGSCVTRVLQGLPEHRDQFLTVQEQATNDRFTPCCSRAKSSRLVLDL